MPLSGEVPRISHHKRVPLLDLLLWWATGAPESGDPLFPRRRGTYPEGQSLASPATKGTAEPTAGIPEIRGLQEANPTRPLITRQTHPEDPVLEFYLSMIGEPTDESDCWRSRGSPYERCHIARLRNLPGCIDASRSYPGRLDEMTDLLNQD